MKTISGILAFLFVIMTALGCAGAEALNAIPQIDNSTARIPITEAIYEYFSEQGANGPKPICSKTHGAWLNLANGTADIIFLVAPTEDELQVFTEAGVDIEIKIFGYDGLVFMGNATNPIDDIASTDIRAIYRGDITDWNNVGDSRAEGEIVPYIRNAESGSQRLFEELVWKGYSLPDFDSPGFKEGEVEGASPLIRQNDMGEVTTSVMENRYSIGYNIMSYVDNVFLDTKAQGPRIVTTGSVNLREGPGLAYEKITSVPAGTELEFEGYTENDDRDVTWYTVLYQGNTVWISSRYSELKTDDSTLKLFSIDGVAPTTENFINRTYPFLTTSCVAIRADEPADSPARQLFDWIGSDDSRRIIEENSTLAVDFSDSVVIHMAESDDRREEVVACLDALPEHLLERSDLFAFTQEELEYLWQGCYAHVGKKFTQRDYEFNFYSRPWYKRPKIHFYGEAYQLMNPTLRENSETILAYLKDLWNINITVQPPVYRLTEEYQWDWMFDSDMYFVQRELDMYADFYSLTEYTGNRALTKDAVKEFQEVNGLEPTGNFDYLTRMMLM